MGLGNRRYAAREHGAALALMQGVKALFDPHGILESRQDLVKPRSRMRSSSA